MSLTSNSHYEESIQLKIGKITYLLQMVTEGDMDSVLLP